MASVSQGAAGGQHPRPATPAGTGAGRVTSLAEVCGLQLFNTNDGAVGFSRGTLWVILCIEIGSSHRAALSMHVQEIAIAHHEQDFTT